MTKLLPLLEAAVAKALEPPVPTCAVLSGGIDSSSVVCVARKLGYELPCFTGYYEGAPWDERRWARWVAGSEWHQVKITPEDFVADFAGFAAACRKPYQGMGAFGQYMVAKRIAARGYARTLSGEGADELFGGYARQYLVAGMKPPDGYEGYELPEGYPRELEKALAYDFARLPDLLAVDEQMLGAFGIEGRAPFTDPALVAWALRLPARHRVGKPVLRRAMRGIVPDPILDRTDKRGFPAPLVEWAQREPVRGFLQAHGVEIPDRERPWAREWFHRLIDNLKGNYGREAWEVAV